MSIYKLPAIDDARGASGIGVQVSLQHDLSDLAQAIVRTRAVRAFDHAALRYPIHRCVRAASRRKLEAVFDDLALHAGLSAQRIDTGTLLLDGPGAFVYASGYAKGGYSSCRFDVWTSSVARVEELRALLLRLVGDSRRRDEMYVIDWHYRHSRGTMFNVSFEEMADAPLLDAAYPSLGMPVASFIERYLASPEAVLVLLGPPGTGKTRLVRAILAALSKRKGDSAEIMFTADMRLLEDDEACIDFVTGSHEAFVIEDADHVLKARTDGNSDMHRLLTIADGVVRSQGRKIIFTTNLPNVRDIDDALLRPGRCFAVCDIRLLEREEAERLADVLCAGDDERRAAATERLRQVSQRAVSVAQVYRACGFAADTRA